MDKQEQTTKLITLEDILGMDQEELKAQAKGVFDSVKLGPIPYTAIDHNEYKAAKKDCMKMVPDGTGGMQPDLDDDKLMVKVIVAAVDKDDRSNFTFANKQLLDKLGVVTADKAVTELLSPGEIFRMAVDIQNLSGFSAKAAEDRKNAVKNS